MARFERLGRRSFIAQLGRGVFGVAVVGLGAACDDASGVATTTTPEASTVGTTSTAPAATTGGDTTTTEAPSVVAGPTFERINLGFVSAYLVVAGSEAAVVDTGTEGNEDAIAGALAELGLDWGSVGHVILTHLHRDHVGSLGPVMASAAGAIGYAGVADLPEISSPRPLSAVGTGDVVFGLDVISTPGHTPGHISLFHPETGVLIAGDAINGAGSGMPDADAVGIAGPNPQFTPDMTTAQESVTVLAALRPSAIYFGHGEPLTGGAAEALEALVGG